MAYLLFTEQQLQKYPIDSIIKIRIGVSGRITEAKILRHIPHRDNAYVLCVKLLDLHGTDWYLVDKDKILTDDTIHTLTKNVLENTESEDLLVNFIKENYKND